MKSFFNLFLLVGLFCSFSCSPKAHKNNNASKSILKVMSYNIHHCNPPSKEGFIDIDAIAAVIKKENPDIVALQEVDIHTARSGKIDQAAQLARKTVLPFFYFAKSIDHDGGDYGVAILSKYPLTDMETHKLPMNADTKGEPRVLAMATIALGSGKKIKFGCTHLDALRINTNRVLQIKEINRIAEVVPIPMIIAGDFNAEENSEVINILDSHFKRTCSACKPTIPVINPRKTIDFIAYKPESKWSALQHEVVNETYASDHLPVTAIFSLHF